jgi:hypothetical protein
VRVCLCAVIQIVAVGGIERITAAMEEHPQNRELQEHACGALLNLAYKNEGMPVLVGLF